MKRLLFLLSLPLLLVSCEDIDSDKFDHIFAHSFVSVYYDGSFFIRHNSMIPNSLHMRLSRYRETIRYCAPEFQKSNTNNEFLKIAERNGDRSYNQTVSYLKDFHPWDTCLANNYKAVRIVCTNKAWDAQHPAGSLLNDIVQIGYDTYAPFIKKGYAGEYYERVKKPLTTLTENDLSMISGVYFYFDNSPARGSYQLKVTLVTTEGVEQGTTFLWEQ